MQFRSLTRLVPLLCVLFWAPLWACGGDESTGRNGVVGTGSTEASGGTGSQQSGVGGGETGGVADDATVPDAKLEPCGGTCPPATPICNEEVDSCVQCLADADCTEASGGRFCVDNACVQCRSSADCTDPAAAHCDEDLHTCVGCQVSTDCEGVAVDGVGLAVCDPGDGRCVQCTGADYSACGVADDGETPLVCNSLERVCSSEKLGGTIRCYVCVSDAACADGLRCVRERFEGVPLDYVCLEAIGVEGVADSCEQRPYLVEQTARTSIDGVVVDVCTLGTATCLARRHFERQECTGEQGSGSCGEPELDDAVCRAGSATSSTGFACSLKCGTSANCPVGFACDFEAAAPACMLEYGSCIDDLDCDSGKVCDDSNRCVVAS